MSETKATHSVTYVGTYNPGNKPYRVTLGVPEEVIKNENAIGWLKRELHNEKSSIHKEFVKQYLDFERLATHNIENLEEVEQVRNG
jgi:hypothetical protein